MAIAINHTHLSEIHNIGHRTVEHTITAAACPAMAAFGMLGTGLSFAKRGFEWVRRTPDFSAVLITFSGQGVALCGDKWVRCPTLRRSEAYEV